MEEHRVPAREPRALLGVPAPTSTCSVELSLPSGYPGGALLALLPLLLAPASTPCGPLDLETVTALAFARSDEVAIKRADMLSAEADRSMARAARILPSATLTMTGGLVPGAEGQAWTSPDFVACKNKAPADCTEQDRASTDNAATRARTFTAWGPFWRAEVQVVQPLWTWGQLDAASDAAEAGLRARGLLVEDTKRQIRQRVLQLYFTAALTRKLLAIGVEVESALEKAEQHVTESLAAQDGEVKMEDKYRTAIFRSDVTQKKAEGDKALALARAGLAGMLAIDEPKLVLDDKPLPEGKGDVPELAASIQAALVGRPDLLALEQAIVARRAGLAAARAAELPQLFIAGSAVYADAPGREQQRSPFAYDPLHELGAGAVIGIRQNLSLPLMFAAVEKAEADLLALERQREGLTRLVTFEVQQAHLELVAADKKAKAAKAALSSGKAWFRSAQLDFGLNVTDARSLLDAYSGYVKTQIDFAQANYEFLVARGRLDQVIGVLAPNGVARCSLE